jgi:NAD(P)-dependent dehydrogenase (short-subunit alcohol dehydrogenase family)
MNASSDGRPSPKTVLAGATAWVVGADRRLGRSAAVELAARGALVWAIGTNERKLGEAVGEIAYQGGRGKHLCLPAEDASLASVLAACRAEQAPVASILALSVAAAEISAPSFDAIVATACSALVPRGALLFLLEGTPDEALADRLRRVARTVERRELGQSVNVVAMPSAAGDADGAARLGALLVTPAAGGLTGQLVVVASA